MYIVISAPAFIRAIPQTLCVYYLLLGPLFVPQNL